MDHQLNSPESPPDPDALDCDSPDHSFYDLLPWDFDLRQYTEDITQAIEAANNNKPKKMMKRKRVLKKTTKMPEDDDPDREYICLVDGCNRVFPSNAQLSYHLGRLHSKGGVSSQNWSQPGRYRCLWPGCLRASNHQDSILQHIKGIHLRYKMISHCEAKQKIAIRKKAREYIEDRGYYE